MISRECLNTVWQAGGFESVLFDPPFIPKSYNTSPKTVSTRGTGRIDPLPLSFPGQPLSVVPSRVIPPILAVLSHPHRTLFHTLVKPVVGFRFAPFYLLW
jgi:hypothetical protein